MPFHQECLRHHYCQKIKCFLFITLIDLDEFKSDITEILLDTPTASFVILCDGTMSPDAATVCVGAIYSVVRILLQLDLVIKVYVCPGNLEILAADPVDMVHSLVQAMQEIQNLTIDWQKELEIVKPSTKPIIISDKFVSHTRSDMASIYLGRDISDKNFLHPLQDQEKLSVWLPCATNPIQNMHNKPLVQGKWENLQASIFGLVETVATTCGNHLCKDMGSFVRPTCELTLIDGTSYAQCGSRAVFINKCTALISLFQNIKSKNVFWMVNFL